MKRIYSDAKKKQLLQGLKELNKRDYEMEFITRYGGSPKRRRKR